MATPRTTATVPNPSTALNQDALNGRVTGALFFIGFGSIWVAMGFLAMHRAKAPFLLLLAAVVVALLAACVWLFRVARDLPPGSLSAEQIERAKRMFAAVNIIQWVSVAAAIFILSVLRHPEYIAPAIAIIVGLHLFPLAQSFHYRQHHITGLLLVAWSLWCIASLPQARVEAPCSLGTGIILLVSAASTLLRCVHALRVHSESPMQDRQLSPAGQ